MSRLTSILCILLLPAAMLAQQTDLARDVREGVLKHLDVGVSLGTTGLGLELSTPLGDYVRVRAGYSYLPSISFNSNFGVDTREQSGFKSYLTKIGKPGDADLLQKINDKLGYDITQIDPSSPDAKFLSTVKEAYDLFNAVPASVFDEVTGGDDAHVTMQLRSRHLHQFRLLVDVMPIPDNKHWNLTLGFFAGASNIGNACNLDEYTPLLNVVNAYNDVYRMYCKQEGVEFSTPKFSSQEIRDHGVAGFKLGYFNNADAATGYKGDQAIMVPGQDGTARATMDVWSVRPYVGLGYSTPLSRDRRWGLKVDAGVLFWGGSPSVYVDNVYRIDTRTLDADEYIYDIMRPNADWTEFVEAEPLQHVDLIHDLHDVQGKVGDMARTISHFKVYPNLSVTFSCRVF